MPIRFGMSGASALAVAVSCLGILAAVPPVHSQGAPAYKVDPMELPRIAPVASEGTHEGAVVAIEYPDHIVCAVRDQDIFLLRIG